MWKGGRLYLFRVSTEIYPFFTFHYFLLTFRSQGATKRLQLVQRPSWCSILFRKQESLCFAAQVDLFYEIPSSTTSISTICCFALAVFVQNQWKCSSSWSVTDLRDRLCYVPNCLLGKFLHWQSSRPSRPLSRPRFVQPVEKKSTVPKRKPLDRYPTSNAAL